MWTDLYERHWYTCTRIFILFLTLKYSGSDVGGDNGGKVNFT